MLFRSIPFVKPINRKQISDIAKKYNNIIILEEHQKSCGVGSAVIEILNDLYFDKIIPIFPRVRRMAIDDKFYSISGSQNYLREEAGLVLKEDYFV